MGRKRRRKQKQYPKKKKVKHGFNNHTLLRISDNYKERGKLRFIQFNNQGIDTKQFYYPKVGLSCVVDLYYQSFNFLTETITKVISPKHFFTDKKEYIIV